jgi:hypothetical protein
MKNLSNRQSTAQAVLCGGELCLSCVLVGTLENPTQVGFNPLMTSAKSCSD